MDLGDSPCSGLVLVIDEAREDECDDAIDPFGSFGGVLVCSVIFSFVIWASSDELMQCTSGFQFGSLFGLGIFIDGVLLCMCGSNSPGQNRAVCSDVLHLMHVISSFAGSPFCKGSPCFRSSSLSLNVSVSVSLHLPHMNQKWVMFFVQRHFCGSWWISSQVIFTFTFDSIVCNKGLDFFPFVTAGDEDRVVVLCC